MHLEEQKRLKNQKVNFLCNYSSPEAVIHLIVQKALFTCKVNQKLHQSLSTLQNFVATQLQIEEAQVVRWNL